MLSIQFIERELLSANTDICGAHTAIVVVVVVKWVPTPHLLHDIPGAYAPILLLLLVMVKWSPGVGTPSTHRFIWPLESPNSLNK